MQVRTDPPLQHCEIEAPGAWQLATIGVGRGGRVAIQVIRLAGVRAGGVLAGVGARVRGRARGAARTAVGGGVRGSAVFGGTEYRRVAGLGIGVRLFPRRVRARWERRPERTAPSGPGRTRKRPESGAAASSAWQSGAHVSSRMESSPVTSPHAAQRRRPSPREGARPRDRAWFEDTRVGPARKRSPRASSGRPLPTFTALPATSRPRPNTRP